MTQSWKKPERHYCCGPNFGCVEEVFSLQNCLEWAVRFNGLSFLYGLSYYLIIT